MRKEGSAFACIWYGQQNPITTFYLERSTPPLPWHHYLPSEFESESGVDLGSGAGSHSGSGVVGAVGVGSSGSGVGALTKMGRALFMCEEGFGLIGLGLG